ncbi:single-strand binding protein [Caldicellulosiruptor hydrothermalis 108]|uniref:Single-stranded DNA-binding protein n=1 Tax=Caldicellulosiruptor hydrothermalis (strain DSM 18901 / VKM B-2411 / 108) TaxID=632292 RepID=E4QDA5_CALH1|nr:single-stranded DNA-binding protein [Caldicellulosiruptor hydrothermalis]ADQ06400.1 single-strand binding protein [Caldicellulosiruptor hydrothermalis 108]
MNKVILMGRLTRDPEFRLTANNTPVANFTLAVNRRFKRENDQDADFIPIVAWSRLAEFSKNYLKKGRQVVVIGRLQLRTWDDEANRRHYITEVVAEEIYFAEPKPKDVPVDSEAEVKEDVVLPELDEEILESDLEDFFEEDSKLPTKSDDIDEGIEDDLPF